MEIRQFIRVNNDIHNIEKEKEKFKKMKFHLDPIITLYYIYIKIIMSHSNYPITYTVYFTVKFI